MTEPLDMQCLFAAVGLEPILRGRPSLHKYQLEKAAAVPRELRRRLMRFLATDSFREGVDVPPFDMDQVQKWVDAGQTAAQGRALMRAVPDRDLATDLGNMANAILTWAKPLLPRHVEQTVMGQRTEDAPPSAIADFRRAWQVAADPMTVLDDLEDGSLSDDQVAVLAQLYPALYQEVRQAIADALAQVAARKPKSWEPFSQKAILIGILRQQDLTDPSLAADVQQAYAQPQQQAPGGRGARRQPAGAKDPSQGALTPGQKAAVGP